MIGEEIDQRRESKHSKGERHQNKREPVWSHNALPIKKKWILFFWLWESQGLISLSHIWHKYSHSESTSSMPLAELEETDIWKKNWDLTGDEKLGYFKLEDNCKFFLVTSQKERHGWHYIFSNGDCLDRKKWKYTDNWKHFKKSGRQQTPRKKQPQPIPVSCLVTPSHRKACNAPSLVRHFSFLLAFFLYLYFKASTVCRGARIKCYL